MATRSGMLSAVPPPAAPAAAPAAAAAASAQSYASTHSTCYRASDNLYNNCPPKMSDGRHFTDYRSQCKINALINKSGDVTHGFDQRMLLTRSADRFIEAQRAHAFRQNVCFHCANPNACQDAAMVAALPNNRCA
jgi:hypothetical protein